MNGADVWAWARAKVAGKRARGRWGRGRARARVHGRARLWLNCGTGRRRGEEGNDRRACLVSRGRMRAGAAERRRESGREAGRGKRFAGLSAPNWAGCRKEGKTGLERWAAGKERGAGRASWAEWG